MSSLVLLGHVFVLHKQRIEWDFQKNIISRMRGEPVQSKPSVFDRLKDDIKKHNEKAVINKAPLSSGAASNNWKVNRHNKNDMSWAKSKLGQTILFGNTTQKRHLETKLANIERQKLQSIRNMEWKQLDMARTLKKEKMDGLKRSASLKSIFNSSVDRQKRRTVAEQATHVVTRLPSVSHAGRLTYTHMDETERSGNTSALTNKSQSDEKDKII